MNAMKRMFGGLFVLCLVLYAGAVATLERPVNDGMVHLTWSTDANPARSAQTALFHQKYPHLTATVDPGLGSDQTKLIVQCATGTGPDIIDMGQQMMRSLVESGVLMDLTPYARKMGFDPARTYPSMGPGLEVDGHQFRFPCNVSADCVLYNKAIFDDHGVPYPKPNWTYDDFVHTCSLILHNPSKSGQKHLALANWLNAWFVQDILVGSGGTLYTPDGLHSALDSPVAIGALQRYADFMFVQKVVPTAAESSAISSQGGWGSSGLTWFSTGKTAMIVIGRWYIVQVPNFPAVRGHLGCVSIPRVPGRPPCSIVEARASGINVKSPHWREALSFLQYLASPEYGKVIVDDGDALPPNPTVARTGKDLVNDLVEDPGFHQPFIDAARNGKTLDVSPFIDVSLAGRWIQETVDRVENRLAQPPEAMRALAAEINATIRLNLERRTDLQKKYEQVTGRKYSPDWWKQ